MSLLIVMRIMLILNCKFNSCDEYEIYKRMDNLYSQLHKESIKKVPIDDFVINENYNSDSIVFSNNEQYLLQNIMKRSIWNKITTCDICREYWSGKLGRYDNFSSVDFSISELEKILRYGYHNYLNNKPLGLDSLLNDNKTYLQYADSIYTFNSKTDSIDGYFIPKDYNDALDHIDIFYPEEYRKIFKSEDIFAILVTEHLNAGMTIRNAWGLWGKSRLAIFFEGLGHYHPDDVSSILLLGYHQKLNGKPHTLEDTLKINEEYFKK